MKNFLLPVFIFLIISLNCYPQTYLGNFTSYSIEGKSIKISSGQSSLKFTFYESDILRVDFYPSTSTIIDSSFVVIQDSSTAINFIVSENDSSLIILSPALKVVCQKNPLRISYYNLSGKLLLKEPKSGGIAFNQGSRSLNFVLNPGDHFYGTGERGTSLDKRGQSFESFNTAIGGYIAALPTMNINIPFLATAQGYALFFDNTFPGNYDLGKSDPSKFTYTAGGGELTYYLIVAPTIREQLDKYTWLTGRQPLPPRWAFGFIQSKYGYRNESEAKEMIQTMKQEEIPCDAIILDLYWFNYMGDVSWDLISWPSPFQMMNDFLKEGIKTIAISEPYIIQSSSNYSYADANGYFAKGQNGNTYILSNWWSCGCNSALLDLTNPAVQNWWWNKYQAFMGTSMAGLWTDLCEPERDDASMQFYLGSRDKVHNIYDLLWAKTLFNGFNQFRPDSRIFNLTRSGYAGIQRYGVIPWSGDVGKDFGGLAVQLPMLLNMGMSGLAYHNSDIGGFCCGTCTTPELYSRWMEYGTFCPVTRAHGVGQPTEPWGYGAEAEAISKKYIQLRYKLLPYIYTMAYENYMTGLPLARPLFFDYPDDNNLTNLSSSYMWGDDLLVSPVVQAGQTTKTIYLPKDKWIDYWSDQIYEGGQNITIPTPLDKLPLFVKEGSIIPMQPLMEYSDEFPLDTLYLDIFPSMEKQASYTLYEDDGKTLQYQNGSFALTTFTAGITAVQDKLNINISISPSVGNYIGKPGKRNYISKIHEVLVKPTQVVVNGSVIQEKQSYSDLKNSAYGYYFDPSLKLLYIQIFTNADSSYNISVNDVLLSIGPGNNFIPSDFNLGQNYPNPFNPTSTIEYQLAAAGKVSLLVYDILGREVKTLVNQYENAGSYKIKFDGRDLPSGIYIYTLRVSYQQDKSMLEFAASKKLVLLK